MINIKKGTQRFRNGRDAHASGGTSDVSDISDFSDIAPVPLVLQCFGDVTRLGLEK